MFSILCRIKCKYHRVHLTELMGKHETTYIYSILCLSLINTHTSRYKSESNARKFLAQGFGTKHWSSYIKLISLNQLFYLNISTSIFKASFDERDYCHFTKKKKKKKTEVSILIHLHDGTKNKISSPEPKIFLCCKSYTRESQRAALDL